MGATTQELSRGTSIPQPTTTPPGRAELGAIAAVAGSVGVVVGIFPLGWPFGLVLAAAAIVVGGRVMRHGPAAPGFGAARTAVALGLIAVLLGLVSAAMWLAGS